MRISGAGMQAAQTVLDVAAHNIANTAAVGPDVGSVADAEPDLVGDVVSLLVAKSMYGANARVLATLAETERDLLDVLA